MDLLKIRFTGTLKPNCKRYLWLSLPTLKSASSGTPLHFAGWKNFFGPDFADKPILVTEGALKADAVNQFRPEFFAVAAGGVSCSHEIIINISRGKTLFLAFDNDYHENPAVLRQLAGLLKRRFDDNRKNNLFAETKILDWSRGTKGIDDALSAGENLKELTLTEWFATLKKEIREAVQNTGEMQEFRNYLESAKYSANFS